MIRCCDPIDRPLTNFSGKARVHYNLHNLCFAVTRDGKVEGYARGLRLRGCKPHVVCSGWERAREKGQRNVHAYLDGEIDGEVKEVPPGPWRELRYNCMTHGPHFFYRDTEETFEGAAEVVLLKVYDGFGERAVVLAKEPS